MRSPILYCHYGTSGRYIAAAAMLLLLLCLPARHLYTPTSCHHCHPGPRLVLQVLCGRGCRGVMGTASWGHSRLAADRGGGAGEIEGMEWMGEHWGGLCFCGRTLINVCLGMRLFGSAQGVLKCVQYSQLSGVTTGGLGQSYHSTISVISYHLSVISCHCPEDKCTCRIPTCHFSAHTEFNAWSPIILQSINQSITLYCP